MKITLVSDSSLEVNETSARMFSLFKNLPVSKSLSLQSEWDNDWDEDDDTEDWVFEESED